MLRSVGRPFTEDDAPAISISSDMLKLRLLASLIGAASSNEDAARDRALRERYEQVSERILVAASVLTKGGENVED